MIITDSFVWINYPKTASTFVRETLKELYELKPRNYMKKWRFRSRFLSEILCTELRPGTGSRYGTPTPHGTISQIPSEYSDLPIASAFRDPVERYVSLYNYGDWKNPDQMPDSIGRIRERFPSYPDLNLLDFIRYANYHYGKTRLKVGNQEWSIGPHTSDFLRFFTKHGYRDETTIWFDCWKSLEKELNLVRFFNSNNISAEFYEWLTLRGFYKKDIEFIIEKPKVNVSPRLSEGKELNDAVVNEIREKEWVLRACLKSNFKNVSEALEVAASEGCDHF